MIKTAIGFVSMTVVFSLAATSVMLCTTAIQYGNYGPEKGMVLGLFATVLAGTAIIICKVLPGRRDR
jgi:hypothetical protein